MGALIVRRLVSLVPLLFVVSFAVFSLTLLVPGDAAITLAGGENASPQAITEIRHDLGLDDPVLVQYGRWVEGAIHLDFGTSLQTHESVTDGIRSHLPITVGLVVAAMIVALLIGLPTGLLAGTRPGGLLDKLCLLGTSLGIAVPSFWLGMILVTIFAVKIHALPAIGYVPFTESPVDWLRHMALPAFALGSFVAASLARQLRAGLVDALHSNYVRTAWAKGGRPRSVVGKHALKNAAIPAVTILGLSFSALLGGTVVIEEVFGIPGLGDYLLRAIVSHDLPVIQGVTVVFVLATVLVNLLVDLTYGYLSPKVRPS